ncbi:MAG: STAS domain-containing protein [Burkholderiaceae bacterium]
MGIFSLFGKKSTQQQPSTGESRAVRARRRDAPNTIAGRAPIPAQREAARETSMKIDAIESEMSSEFVDHADTGRPTRPAPAAAAPAPDSMPAGKARPTLEEALAGGPKPAAFQSTLAMDDSAEFLLSEEGWSGGLQLPASETAQALDEAAILFANNQNDIVEQMLLDGIADGSPSAAAPTAWAMLLDLYQIAGRREAFEELAVRYASTFETSPPTWKDQTAVTGPSTATPATPTVALVGKLDATIVKQLDKIQRLSEKHAALRLEFLRVTGVDPVGCGLLLRVLKKLRKAGIELVLLGAPELADKIRSILQVGRRDETEAPWLLLLELLQLLNREKEFEETGIDYCVTFEVSPPSFVAPRAKVTMARHDEAPDMLSGHFAMPAVIEGKIDDLVHAIVDHAALHQPAILDCSRLARIEFGAAGQLLNSLAPVCNGGRRIEFHDVNHLVAALLRVIGIDSIARVLVRRN